MMTRLYLVRVIRDRWFKISFAGLGIAAAIAVTCAASSDPLADLKAGVAAFESKKYAAAITQIEPLGKRLPKLADYVAWFVASARFELGEYAAVPKSLEPVWKMIPASPLSARAFLLAARAYGQNGDTKGALEVLRKNYAVLPQPAGDYAMASAFAADGDAVNAVIYYQRVYFGFPTSMEAAQAETELAKFRAQLGDKYPPATPATMLGRTAKLFEAKGYGRAREELQSLIPQLSGAEKDLARVRVSEADYNAKETTRAHTSLAALEVSAPEADAERLYYLLLCAQRLKNQEEVTAALEKLARLYPNSKWRLQALIAAASHSLIENQMQAYEPLYRACYESFPRDPQSAGCHWKVTWGHYLRRLPDAGEMLRSHVRMFPASDSASGALYFLGRLSEASHDESAARAYYDEIVREYPNYYYTVLAREQIRMLGTVAPSPKVNEFLRSIDFPKRSRTLNFEPNETSKARMERARMLSQAGLDDWAVAELRYAAQNEDQPHVMAVQLASITARSVGTDQAIRYIKRYAGGYLYMPLESAPMDFWRLAFPLPYRAELEKFAKQNGLDPFLVAALIRQESEFNPKAVSVANARGLTQILPTTGRELSRKLKVKTFTTAALFQPVMNLQLGTFYLKTIADSFGGRWEAVLAAYNAGPSRARNWSTWGEFREPAEFIETVPFAQTHDYIQIVLRNADVYRRIYGGNLARSQEPGARSQNGGGNSSGKRTP